MNLRLTFIRGWSNWQNWVVTISWCLLAVLAAWFGAGWFWQWVTPATLAVPAPELTSPDEAVQRIVQGQIFSSAPDSQDAKQASPGGLAAALEVTGVMTTARTGATVRRGFAILKGVEGKSFAVLEGEEIRPGLLLKQVQSDGILVGQDGTEKWPLREKSDTKPPVPLKPPGS